jgi:hypothetical protein
MVTWLFALALVLQFASLWVLAWYFLRAQARVLQSHEDMTSQVVALKNPWAAKMFNDMKEAQRQQELDHTTARVNEFALPAEEEMLG